MLRLFVGLTVLAIVCVASRVLADLENQQRGGEGGLFTSTSNHLQLVVPRTWHASDQPSYPGILLWLEHGQPDAHIVLTADPFTRDLYCSWVRAGLLARAQRSKDAPSACLATEDSPPMKFACALQMKLKAERVRVGLTEAGPKENELAGMQTVWFEYDDGKHFLRQAVGVTDDRAVSLLLSTSSADARSTYVRAFEQALRTLAPWTDQTATAPDTTTANTAPALPEDGGVLLDAGSAAVTPVFVSAPSVPAQKVHPVGSCAKQ
jgi:hypothetical protein